MEVVVTNTKFNEILREFGYTNITGCKHLGTKYEEYLERRESSQELLLEFLDFLGLNTCCKCKGIDLSIDLIWHEHPKYQALCVVCKEGINDN
jgi:DNA-directed RNA polymerase subunit N (RpoN/RPB10)